MKVSSLTPCGQDCNGCGHFNNGCVGCMATDGVPFWMEHVPMDSCPVFECSVARGVEHCGDCTSYPCRTYMDLRDPSMSDEQWDESVSDRRVNLVARRGKIFW
ncbi:MAG: hypothetical protein CVV64_15330 [Candidatus Wallbacteria bacterium HGW-Wallbacteria-1]|uniref:DUF3795 domain-containing protein n=1 Tax=Candidatus Wallbacteria bacterium HGW-Wallbacteria-1 TaxID=2013854 RepID=A0A2N1PLI0_9BACT|nr:MAG: hypothetical protein CVV64_15330 [Candidatus Wallbacteria bacterium HGW-Wallbacteria-1]